MSKAVLLRIDEWALMDAVNDMGLKSFPIHEPCRVGCHTTGKVGHHVPKCAGCGQSVPDEMEAMYILHNWEVRG